ncbi:MAG: SRPBCC family protein [Betaproteobacteria bacterium]|nr:SRPBCC family protein [Betaproteobacteria bacterium]MBU6511672.1 SRPBCC family protein [Betaproteobacteria bacterium]
MEVTIDKRYPLLVDPERAWALLSDIRAVAGCMPGAQITEQNSDTSYQGLMKVKVGPAQAQFGGTVDVLELDPGARRLALRGKGADKGGSSASMELHAVLEPSADAPGQSTLHGEARVEVTGKFAQFGSRMMVQVSELLLGQFVANFQKAAQQLAAASEASAAASASAATPATPATAGAGAATPGAPPSASAPGSAPRASAGELNGLAILWALLKSWFAGLFGRRGR